MASSPGSESSFNLTKAAVLLVDSEPTSLDLLSRIFVAFGVRSPRKCSSETQAREILCSEMFDLVVTNSQLCDESGYDLVRWIRHSNIEANSTAPLIVLSGYTPLREVGNARDCGASYVVSTPLIPAVLLDRILWVARTPKMFVRCDTYTGPDRRVRNMGPPPGQAGRRAGDLSLEVGEAKAANMSQEDIDSLLPTPMRVQL